MSNYFDLLFCILALANTGDVYVSVTQFSQYSVNCTVIFRTVAVHIVLTGQSTGQNFRKYRTFTGQIIDNDKQMH